MKNFLTSVALAIVLTLIVLAWLAFREGIFDSPEALDPAGRGTRMGELSNNGPSWMLGSRMRAFRTRASRTQAWRSHPLPRAHRLGSAEWRACPRTSSRSMTSKSEMSCAPGTSAPPSTSARCGRAPFRFQEDTLEGVELTLYRDKTGKISIASTFRGPEPEAPPRESPEEPPEGDAWLIGAGPITLKDIILTLGFTANPVRFRIDKVRCASAEVRPIRAR